ncbi:MAG: iron ABC transporter permease [Deltaproteobacteria bacterium]|nr:iron ABC transporter permease [Deltaproteobacteria bacterium]
MILNSPHNITRIIWISLILLVILFIAFSLGLSIGPTKSGIRSAFSALFSSAESDSVYHSIVWRIRFPRVLLATIVGATLSLGGLVFQALLRNPLAEPFILGVSGGSAIGAIIGILLGLSRFPGICFTSFLGSLGTLGLILVMSTGKSILRKDALLLSGVMVNAFCSAIIMFLVSITQDARLHNIIFWLMGDLSAADLPQIVLLGAILLPCFMVVFVFSHAMNLLMMGKDMALTMGINIRAVTLTLLIVTSFMVSATVSFSGLLGFVGLVIPHLLRLVLGPDHRFLVPACLFGGAAYLVLCDLLARTLPQQGEMPAGVITALIGAPLFIILLKKSRK